MDVSVLDVSILVVVLISAVISLFRGFVREVLSLVVWVSAVWIAVHYSDSLAQMIEPYIGMTKLRTVVAFITLFLATLIVGSMVNYVISQLVRKTGLSGTDRMVGVLFGVARGAVIVSVLVVLASVTTLPKTHYWHESHLVEHFAYMAHWLQDTMPPDVTSKLVFDQ